jgi:probable rRNA maturation factor
MLLERDPPAEPGANKRSLRQALKSSPMAIKIANQQETLEFDRGRLRRAAEAILRDAGVDAPQLSIAIVDDATIHDLNRRYLDHDYPTDVLSFLLERRGKRLDGEVVVSAETAAREAAEYGWTAEDELLLYVIHGTLHLVGHDDDTDEASAAMRREERRYLAMFGLTTIDARDTRA